MKDDEEIDSGYDIFKDSGDEDLFFDDIIKKEADKIASESLAHHKTDRKSEQSNKKNVSEKNIFKSGQSSVNNDSMDNLLGDILDNMDDKSTIENSGEEESSPTSQAEDDELLKMLDSLDDIKTQTEAKTVKEKQTADETSEKKPEKTEVKPEKTEVKPEKTEVKPEKTEVKPEKTEVKPEKTEVKMEQEAPEKQKAPEEIKEQELKNDVFNPDELLKSLSSDKDSIFALDERQPFDEEVKTAAKPKDVKDNGLADVVSPEDMALLENTGIKAFFRRIFGNIPIKRSPEEIEKLKEDIKKKADDEEKATEAKSAKKAAAKVAKAKAAQEKKAKAAQKKAEAKVKAAKAAQAKKDAKLKKELEIQNLIDEVDHDEGRINPIGASFVFIMFAVVAVFLILGTKIYSYSVSIKNAETNFDNKHYDDAYEEVYGLDVKDEDEPIYDSIMTVMFTEKELNSYNSYFNVGLYPEALDSLIKGLRRYADYETTAKELGIIIDLQSVRTQILDQLKKSYGLSEDAAEELAGMGDQTAYSEKIYDIATAKYPSAENSRSSSKDGTVVSADSGK